MKALAALCGAAVVAFAISACNQAPPPAAPDTHDADVKAITDLEAQWSKAAQANDVEKGLTYYADDAVMMVPGMDAVQGKEAIGNSMHAMTKDPAFSLAFQTTKADVSKSGDVGYTWGAYQMTATDPATHKALHDHGSYVTVYRKQADGSWKAVEDIATSAVPPPAPKKKA